MIHGTCDSPPQGSCNPYVCGPEVVGVVAEGKAASLERMPAGAKRMEKVIMSSSGISEKNSYNRPWRGHCWSIPTEPSRRDRGSEFGVRQGPMGCPMGGRSYWRCHKSHKLWPGGGWGRNSSPPQTRTHTLGSLASTIKSRKGLTH